MKLLADRFAKYAEHLEKKRGVLADDYFPRVITKEDMKKFADEQIAYLQTSECSFTCVGDPCPD